MKKFYLFAALTAFAMGSHAQQSSKNYDVYDFSQTYWTDIYQDEYPAIGVFYHVSSNGRYATGCDDLVDTGICFYWDAQDAENLTFINATAENRASLRDVTDGGIFVGSVEVQAEPGEMGYCHPAIYTTDGQWTLLPLPETASAYYGTENPYNINEARAVSNDGKHIAGHIYLTRGYKDSPWGLLERAIHAPILWTRNDASGEYEITMLDEIYKNSLRYEEGTLKQIPDSVNLSTFMVYDISDDGSIICGMNEAGCGGSNPVIIRDGQLIQIFDCGEEASYDEDGKPTHSVNFNGGMCSTVDANNNVYGYYQTSDLSMLNFIFTPENELIYIDEFASCGSKTGERFGINMDLPLQPVCCSHDGSVVAGGVLVDLGFGTSESPALMADKDFVVGLKRITPETAEVGIQVQGNTLVVTGRHEVASLVNAAGKTLARGGQGSTFDLSQLPKGIYLVSVETAGGAQTFKFVR